MATYQAILGRNEEVDFTGLAMHVPSKIDTGAFRSSIHATDIVVSVKNGKKTLSCKLLGHPFAPIARDFETTEFDTIEVRSSNGHIEKRYETKLKIKLANKRYETSFSLAARDQNIFPVLIGRKALRRRFMVDVSRSSIKIDKLAKTMGLNANDLAEIRE